MIRKAKKTKQKGKTERNGAFSLVYFLPWASFERYKSETLQEFEFSFFSRSSSG